MISYEDKTQFEDAIQGLHEDKDVNIDKCTAQLKCFRCNSDVVSWFLDKNSDMCLFRCHQCKDSKRIKRSEYEELVHNKPDMRC